MDVDNNTHFDSSCKRQRHREARVQRPENAHCGTDDRRRQKSTQQMSVMERLLMGRISEADLQQRGIELSPEQLELYRRIKGGY